MSNTNEMCRDCKEYFDTGDMYMTSDGDYVCDHCGQDLCPECYKGEQEVETRGGDYICSDCHSGAIDRACDMYDLD